MQYAPLGGVLSDNNTHNNRSGVVEEARFASSLDGPFNFIGGLYYSHFKVHTSFVGNVPLDAISESTAGLAGDQRFTEKVLLPTGQTCANLGLPSTTPSANVAGACLVGLNPAAGGVSAYRDQFLADSETAAFGEATYMVTSKLKLIAGLRVSYTQFDYLQVYGGQEYGFAVPTVANTGLSSGTVKETPITPKFAMQYQITEANMVYATAAKGFRAGGVNTVPSVAICGAGLAATGLTPADIPATYNSDSVWSYEAGAKTRLFGNRVQLNTSAFLIDWTGVQFAVGFPGCGQSFIENAGTARSVGFDFDVAAKVARGVTLSAAVGYDDAEYTASASGPQPKTGGAAQLVVQKGDTLPVAPWTVNMSAQYDYDLAGHESFVRFDYQFTSPYFLTPGPGVAAFAPDIRDAPATHRVNARAGVNFGRTDFNLFVNNLFDSRESLNLAGGRSSCTPNTDPACATYGINNQVYQSTTFRPREIGLQAVYRY